MSRTSGILDQLAYLGFGAITVVFGLQILRMLIIGLAVYLRQIEEISIAILGPVSFAIFAATFLAPIVRRVLGPRNSLALTAGGLGLVRLVEQLVSSMPVDVVLSIIGTVLFLWFIPTFIQGLQVRAASVNSHPAFPILVGISADTAIKGMFDTVDPSWADGVAPHVLMAVLVVCQLLLLWRFTVSRPKEPVSYSPVGGVSLLALGPALALEILLFQNLAQQTALIDWPQPAVFTWILAANLAGIALAATVIRRTTMIPTPVRLVPGALLILLVIDEQSGVLAALVLLAGQTILSLFITLALTTTPNLEARDSNRVAVWSGVGMILFALIIFGYYATYDADLPVPREALPPVAAALTALPALTVGLSSYTGKRAIQFRWAPLLPALFLLLLPLAHFLAWNDVAAVNGEGLPVRVMSYNIRQGFDVEGVLGMEALARVIEEQDPDVVALQEVSRGWVINGSVDTLVWLSQRLDMAYAWGPATDSAWGNAVLSRLPIVDAENISMPNNDDIRIDRGFLAVEIDIGGGEILTVLATHLHAGETEGVLREPQAQAMTEFWNGAETTVLLGDLNAHPEDPEMAHLADAGMLDAFLISGAEGAGFTSASDNPWQRIDYIWVSPDLSARDFVVPQSLASDHFPIAATIFR